MVDSVGEPDHQHHTNRRVPAAVWFSSPACKRAKMASASASVAGAVDHPAQLGETFSEDVVGAAGGRGRAE